MFGIIDKQFCDFIMDYVGYTGPREERNYNGAAACIKMIELLNRRNIGIYRLRKMDKLTLQKIGDIFELSGDRIRQIECKIDRIIKHPICLKMISVGVSPEDEVIDPIFSEVIKKCYPALSSKCHSIDTLNKKEITLNSDIEDLGLSKRAMTCIHRFYLKDKTIKSLLEYLNNHDTYYYKAVRGCGISIKSEIENSLSKYGFTVEYTE